MLDPDTGALTLADSAPLRLHPGMIRSDFLASSFGAGASPNALDAISLTLQGREYGQSWSDWSEAKESARKQAHDRWLEASGVPPVVYPWGTVESDPDKMSGRSCIVVRYKWQGEPWPRVAR